MLTTRACARIDLSPQDIERWPDSSAVRALAAVWCRSHIVTVHFPAMDRSVPICRYLTRLWLDQQHLADQGIRYTALLVTTELATNAIVHTDSTVITANLRRNRTHLRIQVRDQGRGSTGKHWHNASGFGRGLGIVASCTQALGTHVTDDGTRTIWAAVSLTGSEPWCQAEGPPRHTRCR
ncbi:ATP-binding protein [Streptomyces sp. NPDC002671]